MILLMGKVRGTVDARHAPEKAVCAFHGLRPIRMLSDDGSVWMPRSPGTKDLESTIIAEILMVNLGASGATLITRMAMTKGRDVGPIAIHSAKALGSEAILCPNVTLSWELVIAGPTLVMVGHHMHTIRQEKASPRRIVEKHVPMPRIAMDFDIHHTGVRLAISTFIMTSR